MLYIVIRKTTEWENEAVAHAQLPDRLRYSVGLWNSTFSLPYHVFRQELTRIARINRSRIASALCVPRAEVPTGATVAPSDDDDWFSPTLATTLEAAVDGSQVGYRWPSAFIEVPISLGHKLGLIRRSIFPRTSPKWLCITNNYAVTMGPTAAPLIDSHIDASRWFVANPGAVRRLDDHLSVMNRTLASQTSLASVRSQADLLSKFHRYQLVYRRPMEAPLTWCEPYVAMMKDLMDELRHRR